MTSAENDLAELWSSAALPSTAMLTGDDDALHEQFLDRGDERAMRVLVRRHGQASWRLAAVMSGSSSIATAAAQRTWYQTVPTRRSLFDRSLPFRARLLLGLVTRQKTVTPDPSQVDDRVWNEVGGDRAVIAALRALAPRDRAILWWTNVERFPTAPLTTGDPEAVTGATAQFRNALVASATAAAAGPRCEQSLQRAVAYLEDRLGPGDQRVMERHLTGCAHCGSVLDTAESPGPVLVSVLIPAPPDLPNRLLEALGLSNSVPLD